MTTKNLGHYEGIIEDINTKSSKFRILNIKHQQLILLSIDKKKLSSRIEEIDLEISTIKESIKSGINKGIIKWAWIWIKKSSRVKWKQEFINALGRKKAKEVALDYETKEYPQIGIQYIDPEVTSIIQIKNNPRKFPITKHKLS